MFFQREKKIFPTGNKWNGEQKCPAIIHSMPSTVHIPLAFLRILFHIRMKRPRGAKDRSVQFISYSVTCESCFCRDSVCGSCSTSVSGSGDSIRGVDEVPVIFEEPPAAKLLIEKHWCFLYSNVILSGDSGPTLLISLIPFALNNLLFLNGKQNHFKHLAWII